MCTVKCAATESAMLHTALVSLFRACPHHEAQFKFDRVEFPTLAAFTAAMNYLAWQGQSGLSNLLAQAVLDK